MIIPVSNEIPIVKTPKVTFTLIAINILIFFLSSSLVGRGLIGFMYFFGLVPAFVTSMDIGIWYKTFPFLSSIFVHGSWLHLTGNMIFLFIFGMNVEDRMGARKFIYYYFICGIIAGIFHIISDPFSTRPLIGASGAVSGIMGTFLIFYPKAKVRTLFIIKIPFYFRVISVPAYIYIGISFVMQIVLGFIFVSSKIAYWAHVGGFIAGIGSGILIKKSLDRPKVAETIFTKAELIRKNCRRKRHREIEIFIRIRDLLGKRIIDIPLYIYLIWFLLQLLFIKMLLSSFIACPAHALLFVAGIIVIVLTLIIIDHSIYYRSPKTSIKIISYKER